MVLSKDLIAKNIAITQPSGALRDAYQLLFYAGSQKDLLSGKDIAYSKDNQIEMHHIFPKSWIDNNSTGKLKRALDDAKEAGNDLINSAANKMKLSAGSNNEWKAGSPEMVLSDKRIKWNSHKDVLMQSFIDEECFKLLADPYPENKSNVKKFWEKRANLIADELVGLMDVKLER